MPEGDASWVRNGGLAGSGPGFLGGQTLSSTIPGGLETPAHGVRVPELGETGGLRRVHLPHWGPGWKGQRLEGWVGPEEKSTDVLASSGDNSGLPNYQARRGS